MNYPYICVGTNGDFHAYTFDTDKNVYSNAWVNTKPELGNILTNQRIIGHYQICDDTLIIEQISSWTFMHMPWKYAHKKTLGIIFEDTIKISKEQLDIKQKNKIVKSFDIYIPFKSEKH